MRACRCFGQGLAGVAGLILLASGTLAQAPATAPAQPAGKPAAVVNGEPIPLADVERLTDMLLQEKFKVQPPTEAQRKQVRREVLSMLINDVLMRQFVRKHGPQVEPAEVDKQLAEFAANLQKQNPPRTLQDFCKETGQTEAQIRGSLTAMLQWAGYVKAHVTEDDLKRYYAESKEFFDQVAVRASHIVIRVAPDASEGERQAAQAKLQALRADLLAGKIEFAEAARQHSQCPSALQGGDIGYFSRKGMLDENFAKVAYSLKVGEISDLVQTDYGYHLIKVTDRKAGQPSDYEKIKDEVKDFYVEELRQRLLMQEHKAGKIEIHLQ